jgi:hypothetical protein
MIDIPALIAGYLEYLTGYVEYLVANEEDDEGAPNCAVLKRIAADRRAHVALSVIAKENVGQIRDILTLCIDAERHLRTFQSLLASERDNAKQLQQHRQSVADLRQFIDRSAQRPDHPMVDWLPILATEVESTTLIKQLVRVPPAYVSLNINASAGCFANHSNNGAPNAFSNPVFPVWSEYGNCSRDLVKMSPASTRTDARTDPGVSVRSASPMAVNEKRCSWSSVKSPRPARVRMKR